jgi:hypothetical protein
MNIKEFFHENLNYYDDNDKLVSEYNFAKDTLHPNLESFEEIFDAAATVKNLKIYHCDIPKKLFIGFMIVKSDGISGGVARHFMRLGEFRRAGMSEKTIEYRHKQYETD